MPCKSIQQTLQMERGKEERRIGRNDKTTDVRIEIQLKISNNKRFVLGNNKRPNSVGSLLLFILSAQLRIL